MYVQSVGDLLYPVMDKTLETADSKEQEIDTPKDKEQHSRDIVFIDVDRSDPPPLETVDDNVEQESLKGRLVRKYCSLMELKCFSFLYIDLWF